MPNFYTDSGPDEGEWLKLQDEKREALIALYGCVPPDCPKCAGPMEKRHRNSDAAAFWGCRDFPRCRGTKTIEDQFSREDQ